MGIKFIDGNIFSRLSASKPTYICQQVNCKGVMGAGLAMQICIQWPVVYRRYLEYSLPLVNTLQVRTCGTTKVMHYAAYD